MDSLAFIGFTIRDSQSENSGIKENLKIGVA